MKQRGELKMDQLYNGMKVTVSEELEEKLKYIKSSPVKLEKARKALEKLDVEKIRAMRSAK